MKLKSIFVYFTYLFAYLFFCVFHSCRSFGWLVRLGLSVRGGGGGSKTNLLSALKMSVTSFYLEKGTKKSDSIVWVVNRLADFFGIFAQPRVVLVLFLKRLLKNLRDTFFAFLKLKQICVYFTLSLLFWLSLSR